MISCTIFRPVLREVAPWHCAKGPMDQTSPALRRWSPQRSINQSNFHSPYGVNYCHNLNSIKRSRKWWKKAKIRGPKIFFARSARATVNPQNRRYSPTLHTDLCLSYNLWCVAGASFRGTGVYGPHKNAWSQFFTDWVLRKQLTINFWSPTDVCTKLGQLILRKITQTVATRRHTLMLKCTKFDFGWGSATNPVGGAYSAPLDPLAGPKGLLLKGGEGKKKKDEEGMEMGLVGKKGKIKKGDESETPMICWNDATVVQCGHRSLITCMWYGPRG